MVQKAHILFYLVSISLIGCSGSTSLRDKLPDRRPDYRQSNSSHRLEIPPDLVGSSLNDQLIVPTINHGESVSYQDYDPSRYKRNSRGYLDVLPKLYGVQVIEIAGELPYLKVDADPNTTWRAVKKYWENSGIRLRTQEPAIGLMETDWLEDNSQLPMTGVSKFLDNLIKFTHDSGKRDRYRVRFARTGDDKTTVTVIYTQATEKAIGSRKDPEGFEWRVTDNDNPELQLEMTRRLALFVSANLQRQSEGDVKTTLSRGQLSSINGQPVLILSQPYEQAWQTLSMLLNQAGFILEDQDYKNGAYQVSYQDAIAPAKGGLFSGIFSKDSEPNQAYQYLIRLASQGENCVIVVQNLQRQAESAEIAQKILTRLRDVL